MSKLLIGLVIGSLVTFGLMLFIYSSPKKEEANISDNEITIAYYAHPEFPWITSDHKAKSESGKNYIPVMSNDISPSTLAINPVTQQKMGIRTHLVKKRKFSSTIRVSGVAEIQNGKEVSVSLKSESWIETLTANQVGKSIKKGDILFEVYSPTLITAQQEYLSALAYSSSLDKTSPVYASANQLKNQSEQKLRNLDISEAFISELEHSKNILRTVPIYAPISGQLIELMLRTGDAIMPGMTVMKIADISSLWITAQIFESDIQNLKKGDPATIVISEKLQLVQESFVTEFLPMVQMEARTIPIRLHYVNNKDVKLTPGQWVTVEIKSNEKINLAVPTESVVPTGNQMVVIMYLGNGYVEARQVQIGIEKDGFREIISGLHEGERIVTSAQFLIDSESNFRAAIQRMATEGISVGSGVHQHESASFVYVCPMHPDIIRQEPGTCPKCKMDLVKKKL